jgi:hypothetical protein
VEERGRRGDVRHTERDGSEAMESHGLDKLDHLIDNCNP